MTEELEQLLKNLKLRRMQKYFRVSPPSVHQMVLTLEANGVIERIPGRGRSIHLLIPREELPDLE
jgi:Mn-dependent DtxR family transcriptional regulator